MAYYQEGMDARWRGESVFRCPYKVGTAGFVYWCRGWQDAVGETAGSH